MDWTILLKLLISSKNSVTKDMKHWKYHNCFALRFNLYKCGYTFSENIHVFAGMYGEDEKFLETCAIPAKMDTKKLQQTK